MIIDVNLPENRYSIHIGKDLFRMDLPLLADLLKEISGLLVVTDDEVQAACYPHLGGYLDRMGVEVAQFVIGGGEGDKTLDTLSDCYEVMCASHLDRDSVVLALGGGIVGDLAGFAASTFMRGLPLVNIPTTLLAMVDSAIGGKNAVNLPWGKNMVGTFHQPSLVLVNLDFLETLPREAFLDGMAEVIKYCVLSGEDLAAAVMERSNEMQALDYAFINEIVAKCCSLKVKIIVEDERDQGVRAKLNFGHTIGHALEVAGNFSRYTHGEALSIGMRGAFMLSKRLGLVGEEELRMLEDLMSIWGLPRKWSIGGVDSMELWKHMLRDKKARGRKLDFVLTKGFGSVIIRDIKAEKGLVLKVLDDLSE